MIVVSGRASSADERRDLGRAAARCREPEAVVEADHREDVDDDLLRKAREVGVHMLQVLDRMQEDPDRWRAKNPPNGWGDYDRCLQGRMRAWATLAAAAGESDRVGGWL